MMFFAKLKVKTAVMLPNTTKATSKMMVILSSLGERRFLLVVGLGCVIKFFSSVKNKILNWRSVCCKYYTNPDDFRKGGKYLVHGWRWDR